MNTYSTYGILHLSDGSLIDPFCLTLEPPWKFNERNISCIPTGVYECKLLVGDDGPFYLINDVPNRDGIIIHIGNDYRDTKGCILLGEYFQRIPHMQKIGIANSKKVCSHFIMWTEKIDRFQLIIRQVY